jgi:hypothetical protein
MAIELFNGKLTAAFQPTKPVMVAGETIVLDFLATIANLVTPPATPGLVEWYLEYCYTDPNAAATRWFQECAEEDKGNGVVRMAKVIRYFSENAADVALAVGVHMIDTQFARKHAFYRLQVRATGADNCSLIVASPFGSIPISPST